MAGSTRPSNSQRRTTIAVANRNAARGFRPVANLTGGGEYIRTHSHPAADSVAVGKWDLVTHTGAADTVEQFDANDPIYGVALNYVALSTLGAVSVLHVNHTSLLEAQEDSDGGDIAAASEGLNAAVIVAAANTTTGLSQMMIDSSSAATTSSLDVRLYSPSPRAGNTVAQDFALWLCTPLDLQVGQATVGI